MKVAAIQHDIFWEEPERTRAHLAPMIADAAGQGARLISVTEMFATGFSMRPERIGEPEGGPSEQFLLEQASAHDVFLIGSIAQQGADGQYRNNAIVAAPDGRVWRYAKIHPFTYAGEHEHYAAGDRFLTVELDGLRVSPFVCYDLRFADEFWALAPDTDLYVVPANWPSARVEHWRALLRARAIENQAYVLGREPGRPGPDAGARRGVGDHRSAGRGAGRVDRSRGGADRRGRPGRSGPGPRRVAVSAGPAKLVRFGG